MQTYRWATLGCGVIANELAQALASRGQKLYSVANRTHAKAVAFAEKYGIEKVYDQIDDVFADENVDIIYISTPHNTHIQYLRKALAAGKHVLCEKSITLNSDELEEAIRLAEAHHVVLAEAMTCLLYTSGLASFSASINSSNTPHTRPASALFIISKNSLIL